MTEVELVKNKLSELTNEETAELIEMLIDLKMAEILEQLAIKLNEAATKF